jgi:hypothetical protein
MEFNREFKRMSSSKVAWRLEEIKENFERETRLGKVRKALRGFHKFHVSTLKALTTRAYVQVYLVPPKKAWEQRKLRMKMTRNTGE